MELLAYLATSLTVPSPAIAAPVAAFFGAIFSAISAGVAALVGSTLGMVALAVGVSVLASFLLMRNIAQQQPPSQLMVNPRTSVRNRTKSYGTVRVGGPVYFWQASRNNNVNRPRRYVGIVLMTGQIDGFVSHFFDEREIALDANGYPIDSRYYIGNESEPRARLELRTGAMNQPAPQLLQEVFPEWTANHRLPGCAHVAMWFQNVPQQHFTVVYPTGREPVYTAVIRAARVFDPRDGATRWTRNAALIIADWITSPDGMNREVDWEIVKEEAAHADVLVTNRAGQQQRKWEICGTYAFNETRDTVRSVAGLACDAFFYQTVEGKVAFRVGRWIPPDVTITDHQIVGARLVEGARGTNIYNSWVIEYSEPARNFREAECAPYQIDDGRDYSQNTTKLYWIPTHNQASRVAKRLLLVSRARYSVSLTLTLHGLRLLERRFFRLNSQDLGIDTFFEIDRLTLGGDGMTVQVDAHSVQPSDFDFNAATEEGAPPQKEVIDDATGIQDPTGVAAQARVIATGDGTATVIRLSWAPATSDNVRHEIRYRLEGTTAWTVLDVPQGQLFRDTDILNVGSFYELQVRALVQGTKTSEWAPEPPLSVLADNASAPEAIQDHILWSPDVGQVELWWEASPSPNAVGTRVYQNDTNNFATADLADTVFHEPNIWVQWGPHGGFTSSETYYFWLVPINAAGQPGPTYNAGSVVVQ